MPRARVVLASMPLDLSAEESKRQLFQRHLRRSRPVLIRLFVNGIQLNEYARLECGRPALARA